MCARLSYDTEGNDVATGFYASGQVVFEAASFFNRTPSSEYIQVLTACQGRMLAMITEPAAARYESLLKANPGIL